MFWFLLFVAAIVAICKIVFSWRISWWFVVAIPMIPLLLKILLWSIVAFMVVLGLVLLCSFLHMTWKHHRSKKDRLERLSRVEDRE